MRILECSSRGDKRFSAFYARVSFFGKTDSIENIYQSVKRDINGAIAGKGKRVSYIVIQEHKLDVKYLTPLYKMLWVKYLDNNPELVKYASQYDDYNDMFGRNCVNCQADVIRQYIKQGRQSIMTEPLVQELNNIIRSWK
jgi:hypothetical protein